MSGGLASVNGRCEDVVEAEGGAGESGAEREVVEWAVGVRGRVLERVRGGRVRLRDDDESETEEGKRLDVDTAEMAEDDTEEFESFLGRAPRSEVSESVED